MKAVEFITKIQSNKILIPDDIDLNINSEQVRVIVLFEDEDNPERFINQTVEDQFLKGFSEPDSIYDTN